MEPLVHGPSSEVTQKDLDRRAMLQRVCMGSEQTWRGYAIVNHFRKMLTIRECKCIRSRHVGVIVLEDLVTFHWSSEKILGFQLHVIGTNYSKFYVDQIISSDFFPEF